MCNDDDYVPPLSFGQFEWIPEPPKEEVHLDWLFEPWVTERPIGYLDDAKLFGKPIPIDVIPLRMNNAVGSDVVQPRAQFAPVLPVMFPITDFNKILYSQ